MKGWVLSDDAFPYAFDLRLKFFFLADVALEVVLLVPWARAALVQETDEKLLGVRPGDLFGV